MYDLLIRGGQLIGEQGVVCADLAVEDGRIVALAPELEGSARAEIDAAGLHVFPGVVDVHVHFNEPGRSEWEGVSTGSRALVAGGGTTFADMPLNSSPPVLNRETFGAKRQAAEGACYADFALWGGLTPHNLEHLPELAEAGVVGFKAFMSDSGLAEFAAADDLTLYEGMHAAQALGRVVAVHAESETITARLGARIRAAGGREVGDYLQSRPAIAEVEAVGRALLLAEETGAALHLVHLSTGRAVTLAVEARRRGVNVSVETCPHYLCFTGEDMERLGAVLKCAPPLRGRAEVEALWASIRAGEINTIGSDHSPSTPDLKARDDFFEVWGGIAGVQSTLAALLTEGRKRGLGLPLLSSLLSANPARRFALQGKGGCNRATTPIWSWWTSEPSGPTRPRICTPAGSPALTSDRPSSDTSSAPSCAVTPSTGMDAFPQRRGDDSCARRCRGRSTAPPPCGPSPLTQVCAGPSRL